MPKSRKNKKGKKGGKRAAAPIPPTDGRASHETTEAPRVNEAATDATSPALPGLAGSEGKVLSRRETKDRMLAKAGVERIPSSNPMFRRPVPLVELSKTLRLNVIGPDGTSVVGENVSILRHNMAKKAYAIIKRHQEGWEMLLGQVLVHGKAVENLRQQKNSAKCDQFATAVLDGIEGALSDIPRGENQLAFVHKAQILARHYRCTARFNLNDLEGSIEDATEGLALLEAWGDDNEDNGDAETLMRHQFLLNRGECLSRTTSGKLDGAEVDLRAACASLRLLKDLDISDNESTSLLLKVMATRKVKANVPRPHYTVKQRERIQKELRIGVYSARRYRCLGCGVEPSDTVKLLCCGGCDKVWLCSEECQTAAWPQHKKNCGHFPELLDVDTSRIVRDIKVGECGVVGDEDGPLRLVCRDEGTGQLFFSLSDDNVLLSNEP